MHGLIQYEGRKATGVSPGLQNRCGVPGILDGFDSHMPSPKRKKSMNKNISVNSENKEEKIV